MWSGDPLSQQLRRSLDVQDREVERNLARLAGKPVLIVWPDGDPGFGDAELRRWQSIFPAASTVRLARAGQFIDEDAPDDVGAAIENWWVEAGVGGQVRRVG